jgi:hypothetical protein
MGFLFLLLSGHRPGSRNETRKAKDKGLKANFFGDVSQDVSQLNSAVIHRLWKIEPLPICLNCIICPLCFHGRYRADDPGRGLPGIGYFQTNALAAEKIRPIVAFICALFSEVFKSLGESLYRKAQRAAISQALMREAKPGQR